MLVTERQLQRGIFDSKPFDTNRLGHTFLRREVPIGEAIPDLVLVNLTNIPDPAIWPTRLSYRHTYVIWLLRKFQTLTVEVIAKRSYETPTRTLYIVEDLVKTGAIISADRQRYSLSPEIENLKGEVIAIEVKLRNWNQAIAQALRYSEFASSVTVAMPADGVPNQEVAHSKFMQYGIGLCAIEEQFSVSWLIRPKTTKIYSPETEYLVASASNPRSQTAWTRL